MRWILTSVFVLALCAAPLAMAQQRTVSAEIPFPFVINNMKCAPGEWLFSRNAADPGRVILVKNVRTNEGLLFVINLATDDSPKVAPKLVFHRYGDKYFLREIHEGNSTMAALIAGAEERKLLVAGMQGGKAVVLARLR